MRCLPFCGCKEKTNNCDILWKHIKTGEPHSFNDHPAIVIDYDGENHPDKEWCNQGSEERGYGKPSAIEVNMHDFFSFLSMRWNNLDINVEEIHPDYRDAWVRICTEAEES